MWNNVFVFFTFSFVILNVMVVDGTENSENEQNPCNPKACTRSDVEKNVCGSDGLTYPSRCLFEKARCKNRTMTLVKRGSCNSQRPCQEWNITSSSFKPTCREDGTYDSAQCHPDTGVCWCVTSDGVPLPYTTIEKKAGSKLRCGNQKKNHRRSPSRKRKARTCKPSDKSILSNNLINSFQSEYDRENGKHDLDTIVVIWKFRILDLDNNEILDQREYRDIKKVVKKAVKPKKCAKNFPNHCDLDGDHLISLQEWSKCLKRESVDATQSNMAAMKNNKVLNSGTIMSIGPSNDDDSSEMREDATDCLSDRRTALSEGYQDYVPECTPDGRYQKIQCYKSAGYCWCVNEDTGKNIPGTSLKNGIPKCDMFKTSFKSIKGCPQEKKNIFLKDLLQVLYAKMAEMVNGNSTFNSLAWIASKEEKAATWSFVVLDKNKNKMLERNEWKSFKDIFSSIKGPKKCGKKLPRYCDSNRDRQISMTEWLECLNVQQASSTPNTPSISSRAGKKNPLGVLKGD